MMKPLTFAFAVVGLLVGAAASPVALAAGQTFAITGGTVYTLGAAGKIERGTVLIRDGKIAAVGADVAIPADAERIDATGKVVTPGIFDPESQFGLVEVGSVKQTRDAATTRFGAAFNVTDAINPRSVLIPVNRIAGVTRAVVAPTGARPGGSGKGHVLIGQGAIMDLGSTRDYVHRAPAAMFAVLGESGAAAAGGSRAAALMVLRNALTDAKAYAGNPGKYLQAHPDADVFSKGDLEALQPVIDGKMPLVVKVDRASDIEAALRLADGFDLDLVVSGGAEAWMVADDLAAAGVPVLLNPLEDLPARFESMGSTLENAARLQKAGVLIAFATGDTFNARNMTQAAGNAVAYGLPWQEALKALTVNGARIYGVADRVGSLDRDKVGDVVIWSGDPLELTTHAEQVFIAGRKIPMVSRQTMLRDRYLRALKDASPPAYIQPASPTQP